MATSPYFASLSEGHEPQNFTMENFSERTAWSEVKTINDFPYYKRLSKNTAALSLFFTHSTE